MKSRSSSFISAGLFLFSVFCLIAVPAGAAGPHDNECKDCHSIHYSRGDAIIAVDPFQPQNPSTGMSVTDVSSLCLGCHNEDGDATAIELHQSHPIGITPVTATVPPDKLSENGLLSCVSCHDPHPSNPHYAYLIVDTDDGAVMGEFCAVCHPQKRE